MGAWSGDRADGVAIVGMAVLLPGAPDLGTYWRNLVDGIPVWDRLIDEFNAEVGAGRAH